MDKLERVAEVYAMLGTVRATARHIGVSTAAIKKALITLGIYPTQRCVQVHEMLAAGMDEKSIARVLGTRPKTLNGYVPYDKGSYVIGEKSVNALKIAHTRKRQREKRKS